ncbi:MAG: hypothetical protein ACKVU1_15435 [bacterium]
MGRDYRAQGSGEQHKRGASVWRDPALWFVMAAALAHRVVLLATTCAHAHADEAIVGVMARHILERGERPLFYYGQSYGGGGALEAYAAALLFAVFGESTVALKMAPLVFWLASIPAAYWVARALGGRGAARLAIVLYSFAPPAFEWSLAARGGYVETMLFSMLLVVVALPLVGCGRRGERAGVGESQSERESESACVDDASDAPNAASAWRWVLLGALAGFAFYIFGLIAPAIVTLAVVLVAARAVPRRALAPLAAGLVAGAAPIVYENVRHRFVNLRHLVTPGKSDGFAARVADLAGNFVQLATHDLPAFFTPWIDDFVERVPLDAWAFAAAMLVLCVAQAWSARPAWSDAWRAFRTHGAGGARVGPAIIPALYVALYALAYIASRFAGVTPRYLLALYPMIAVMAACGAVALFRSPRRAARVVAALATFVLIAVSLVRAALYVGPATTREYNVATRGDSIPQLLALLDRSDARVVFATPPIKWKILWEGRERLLAATHFYSQEDWFRFPEFERTALERAAWGDEPAAFVTHADFAYERVWGTNDVRSLLASRERFEDALAARGVRYERERAGDFLVYSRFTKNVPRLLLGREFFIKGKYFVENGDRAQAVSFLERAAALDAEDPEIARLLVVARGR